MQKINNGRAISAVMIRCLMTALPVVEFTIAELCAGEAETPLASTVLFDRLQQLLAREVRPEGFSKVKFRISHLPEQKIADAHLATGPDQQVRVRDRMGIEGSVNIRFREIFGLQPAAGNLATECLHGPGQFIT